MNRIFPIVKRPNLSLVAVLLALSAALSVQAGSGDLELQFTVGTDLSEDACATTTTIAVGYGDQVNLCYRIVNHGSQTLRYHTLHDDSVERMLTLEAIELPPGGSYQHNRIAAANETRSITARWHALASEPGYTVEENDPAVLFRDGFEGDDAVQHGFVDISETGAELFIPPLTEWTMVELPFAFDFYGIVSDRLRMIEYGAIGWDPVPGVNNAIRYLPQTIQSAHGPGLMPYWTNMYDSGGRFFYQVLGQAPNRRALLQWHELHYHRGHFPGSGTVTFQLALAEGSNRIEFNYRDAAFGDPAYDYGRAATVGLGSGTPFRLQYSRLEASLADHFTLRFTPDPVASDSASATVTIDVGAPVVAVLPEQFSATLPAGGIDSATLEIGNLGTRDLTWSLDEAPPRMHFPATARARVSRSTAGNGAPIGTGGLGQPLGLDAQVPAYAWMDTPLESFVRLDVAAPQASLEIIDDGVRRFFLGGDFIDNDFSAFYALDWWSNQLVRMLTENCHCSDQIVVIGPPGNPAGGPQPRAGNWVGMSHDSSNGQIYAIAASILYRIDLATVRAWELGAITGVAGNPAGGTRIEDIAVSPEGLMYGVEAIGDTLVAIDKVTGEGAIIGPLGIDLATGYRPQIGLDFDDATGTLYLAANDAIYTVDVGTGWARLVATPGPDAQPLDSLAIATSSPCSRPQDIPWLSLEPPGSGSNAPDEWSSLVVAFDAAGLAPGDYTANLCVTNNDPLRGRVIVPVALTVE